jgi:hypothetical protein
MPAFFHHINEFFAVEIQFFGERVNAYWHWVGVLSNSIGEVRSQFLAAAASWFRSSKSHKKTSIVATASR